MAKRFRIFESPYFRLTAYYLSVVVVCGVLLWQFESLWSAFTFERLSQPIELVGVQDAATPGAPFQTALEALIAIVGALVVLAPVAWVYMITKQEKGYDESVVHTVLILPVPVTGLVIVVQNSLALAFSLAGIVAAVRFRNTLEDTKDAVYIFLAIGTALAAGAQALGVAFVTSVAFNYLVLLMWHKKIGNIYADAIKGRTRRMRLGDVLAGVGSTPLAGSGNLTIGDPSLLSAIVPNSLTAVAEKRAKLRDIIDASGKKSYNGLLVMLAKGNEEFFDAIDEVLRQYTERHKLAEVSPTPDGSSTLEYLVGMPKDLPPSQLISTLKARAGKYILAAEYRNLVPEKAKKARSPHWTLPK